MAKNRSNVATSK